MAQLDEILADKDRYPDSTPVTLAEGTTVTLGELRGGYMKDADYRRKTAEVARQREELERIWAARQAELAAAEDKLQTLAADLLARMQQGGATPTEAVEALEDDPRLARLRKEIDELKAVMSPMAQALVDLDNRYRTGVIQSIALQHRAVLEQLKKTDPELDDQALVQFAKARGIPRLDDAYVVMKRDALIQRKVEEAKKAAFQEGYEKAKQESVAAPWLPIRRATAPAPDAPKTMDEALEKAASDPDVIGPLLGRPS